MDLDPLWRRNQFPQKAFMKSKQFSTKRVIFPGKLKQFTHTLEKWFNTKGNYAVERLQQVFHEENLVNLVGTSPFMA